MKIEDNNLNGFGGWHDNAEEVDFFSEPQEIDQTSTDVKSVIDEITKEDDEVIDPKNPTTVVDKEEDLFTGMAVNQDEHVDEDEDDTTSVEAPNLFILNKLKEKGFIDFELEEGQELTDEEAEELIEEKFDESVDNKVKELMTELPDDKKQAVQFLIKGGSLNDLISAYSTPNSINIDVDLEKEENQISTLKKLLALEGNDDEEIEAQLEYLKDSGKLKLITEKKFAKYKTDYEGNQKEILKSQEEAKEKEKVDIKEAKTKVATFLNTNAEVNGIKFSLTDKKELPSYMSEKTVKLMNGTKITQMQADLFYNIPKNEVALIQLATLLKNRNEDGSLNFDSITKSTTTKVAQEVRDNVRRKKSSIPGSSLSKNNNGQTKALADYF